MQANAEGVQYKLPNEHSRVRFLLEAIECSDPTLQADMARIKIDNGPEGMRNNFDATAAYLLHYDPVAKKRSNGYNRSSTQISSVMGTSNATTRKPSIGLTGVHLCYHKNTEYKTLTPEQKGELHEWRANNPNIPKKGAKKPKKEAYEKPKSFMKKQVASLVEVELKRAARSEVLESDKKNISCLWLKQ